MWRRGNNWRMAWRGWKKKAFNKQFNGALTVIKKKKKKKVNALAPNGYGRSFKEMWAEGGTVNPPESRKRARKSQKKREGSVFWGA